jgi:hypothetical protein
MSATTIPNFFILNPTCQTGNFVENRVMNIVKRAYFMKNRFAQFFEQMTPEACNARLYAEVQGKAKCELLIASIGQKIQTTTSVESVLQVVAREIESARKTQTSVHLPQTGEEQVFMQNSMDIK